MLTTRNSLQRASKAPACILHKNDEERNNYKKRKKSQRKTFLYEEITKKKSYRIEKW